jgi:hypothetical protein
MDQYKILFPVMPAGEYFEYFDFSVLAGRWPLSREKEMKDYKCF